MDGHTGIKNEKVNEANADPFRLVLSALEEDAHAFSFVVHATTNWLFGSGVHPAELLSRIGYTKFGGRCPFHSNDCYWIDVARIRRGGDPGHWHTQNVHDSFKRHAELLPQLRVRYGELLALVSLPGSNRLDLFPELSTREVPLLEPSPGTLPSWVVAEMPVRFQEVERAARKALLEYDRMKKVAGLLWDGDEPLVDAVLEVFKSCGFRGQKTEKGATWDITIEIDGERRLLVEVSGIEGALKKRSNKISQTLSAKQHARDQDRVVLAMNLNREVPLLQRSSCEAVTRDAMELLTPLNVVVVQTSTLFEIWKTGLGNPEKSRAELAALHSEAAGLLIRKPTA